MSLELFFHPLSSFCHKTLIALYENATPFEPRIVNLGDADEHAAFLKVWPIGKFPVLRDNARNVVIPESSIIIEYLARYYPGGTSLVPDDPDLARHVRASDRFFDLNVQAPMQKIVGDRIRPAGQNDPFGVAQARAQLAAALDVVDRDLSGKTWAVGDGFTMADCAAAPALYYANRVAPFEGTHKHAAAYFARLQQRPSYARTLEEAAPYLSMFPT